MYNPFFSSYWIFQHYNIVYCLLNNNLILTIGTNKDSIVLKCTLAILSIYIAYISSNIDIDIYSNIDINIYIYTYTYLYIPNYTNNK